MKILIIDGQGGGLGRALTARIRGSYPEVHIAVAGTNSIATSAMLKAGATCGATGDNAIIYNSRDADVIIGALGIAFANAMHGEISPAVAGAVSASAAQKILIPVSKCNVTIAGTAEKTMAQYIDDVLSELDLDRQKQLLKRMQSVQTIMTCTHLDEGLRAGGMKVFEIEDGSIMNSE